jgi:hypothetical protein
MRRGRFSVPSEVKQVADLNITANPRNEPSFVGATCDFVRRTADRATQQFLDGVEDQGWVRGTFVVYVFNTRLHPGSWPTDTPAWHVDGQEDATILHHKRLPVESLACCYTYQGETANTEFALGRAELEAPKHARSLPNSARFPWWHYQVEEQLQFGALERMSLRNCGLYAFDDKALHRAPWVIYPGERILWAVSRYTQGQKTWGNEKIFDFTQRVYVPSANGLGWKEKKLRM